MAVIAEQEKASANASADMAIKPKPDPGRKEGRISRSFKIFLTIWAFMENAIFAGLRAGWPALVYVLKKEHIYADLCLTDVESANVAVSLHHEANEKMVHSTFILRSSSQGSGLPNITSNLRTGSALRGGANNESYLSALFTNQSLVGSGTGLSLAGMNVTSEGNATASQIGCDEQDAIFNQCFTVATATMALSALMYGHLNYKFGIRVPRILSVFLFVGGAVCFAFVNQDIPWLIYPGLLLVSSGGMALYITNNQISYMFTTGGAAVVGLLCGALEASSFIQTVIKIAYENGVSLKISYFVLAALYCTTLISTLFFLPKDFITNIKVTKPADEDVCSSTCDSQSKRGSIDSLSKTGAVVMKDHLDDTDGDTGQLPNKNVDKECMKIHENADNKTSKGHGQAVWSVNSSEKDHSKSADVAVVDETSVKNKAEKPAHESNQPMVKSLTNDKQPIIASVLKHSSHLYQNPATMTPPLNAKPAILGGSVHQLLRPQTHLNSKLGLEDQLHPTEGKILMAEANNQSESSMSSKDVTESSQSQAQAANGASTKTLLKCLLSRTFALYLFWASTVQIILSMCLGTFNPWLEYVTDMDNDKVSKNTDILLYSMLASPILALSIGLGMDALKKGRKRDRKAKNIRTLHTAIVSLGVTSILSVILCALFVISGQEIIIVTSLALVIFRTLLYSCGTAFLRIMYPTQYFGILLGIMSVLSGGLGFLQYPLFLWVQARRQAWEEVFGFLGILGLVSLAQPIYLFWKSRQIAQFSDVSLTSK